MKEEKKPPDDTLSPEENMVKDDSEKLPSFPLKNVFDEALERAREIRKKYSEEQNTKTE